jgi:hypothetical protein
MCRRNNYQKDKCQIQWFDPIDQPLKLFGEITDLVIQNATFYDNMGLYTCQICCYDQCQKFTSFIYPVRISRKIFFFFNYFVLGGWRRLVKRHIELKDFIQCKYLCVYFFVFFYYCLYFL